MPTGAMSQSLWYKGQYYATKLSEVNSEGYYLTGWYDNFGCAAGKRAVSYTHLSTLHEHKAKKL